MSCDNCQSQNYSISLQNCSASETDSSKIKYTGPALTCTDVATGTDLQTILQTFDAAICENSGIDWSAFEYNCLPTICSCSISSAAEFVDAITTAFCDLKGSFTTFVNTTYSSDLLDIQNDISAIVSPGLTLACSSVVNTDNLNTILTKFNTQFCNLKNEVFTPELTIACANVSDTDSLAGAVNKIGTTLCDLSNTVTTIQNNLLPTFNNSTSCLSIDGTSDSLYNTVVAIRDLVCLKAEFVTEGLSWGCVYPATDLTNTVQNILTMIESLNQVKIMTVNSLVGKSSRISAVLTPIDSENACAGYDLSLVDLDSSFDIKVKTNSSDSTSGYLVDKIVEGDGIDISVVDVAGVKHLKIDATNEDTYKVKVKSDGSDTEGYLINKLDVTSTLDGALVLSKAYSSTTDALTISPALNYEQLTSQILTTIINNTTLNNIFCNMLACKCDCSNPVESNRTVLVKFANEAGAAVTTTTTINQVGSPSQLYSGTMSLADTQEVSLGYSVITDTSASPELAITVTNSSGIPINCNVIVKDSTDTVIITDINIDLNDGDTQIWSPFPPYLNGVSLGSMASNTNVIVHVIYGAIRG